MEHTVKHGGCHDCHTFNVKTLHSMPIQGQMASKAVCAGCWEQQHPGQKLPKEVR